MTAPSACTLFRASLALSFAFALPGLAAAQEGDVENGLGASRADYDIRAKLERFELDVDGASTRRFRLEGSETIRWTNGSADEVPDLHFHLYLNAFSNNRSTHMIETGTDLRGRRTASLAEEWWWGWQEVGSVRVNGADVTASLRYLNPDGPPFPEQEAPGALDRTVFAVDAPRPIAPGETVEIEVRWSSLLPRVRRRTGTKGDFLFVAQWFPKLGVYESGRGWNCHTFHAFTEFFADFGTYRVSLDLPREYSDRVGGSGVRTQNLVRGADRVEVVFEAPALADRARPDAFGKLPLVHDFAWTGDPGFVVYTNTFRAEEWKLEYQREVQRAQEAFGADVDFGLRDVAVTVLLQKEHEGQAFRHFHATCAALFFYGLWFGGYPYEHVTVVDPAWGGRAAGGMEYPTLFTSGTRLFTKPDMYVPESVTVHEAGHQFWYGLAGNNEFEAAWLDEGLNSYTDSEVLWRVYGPRRHTTDYFRIPHCGLRPTSLPGGERAARALLGRDWNLGFLKGRGPLDRLSGVRIDPLRAGGLIDWWRDQPLLTLAPAFDDPRWGDRAGYLRDPDSDPIETFGWLYVDRASYRTNSYPRPAVALRTLAGLVGFEAFLRGMRHFAGEWRYGHPYPEDFYAAFLEGSGADVRWYFEDAFQSIKTIDWSVEVREAPIPDELGYFVGPDGGLEERRPAGRERVDEASDDEGSRHRPRRAEIVLRRKGELCLPLPWQVRIETVGRGRTGSAAEEVLDHVWTREEQLEQAWHRTVLELPHDKRVKSVVLDPERKYYLDLDMSDNQWYRAADRVTPLRWGERVLHQYQHLLHWFAGIGG